MQKQQPDFLCWWYNENVEWKRNRSTHQRSSCMKSINRVHVYNFCAGEEQIFIFAVTDSTRIASAIHEVKNNWQSIDITFCRKSAYSNLICYAGPNINTMAATAMTNSSPDDITTDMAELLTGVPSCSPNDSATPWIILFAITFVALVISITINIFLCCRARGEQINMTRIFLLCKRRQYDVEKNDYAAVPTTQVSNPDGKPPESDYEMPMGLNARIAKAFTFPRTSIQAEHLKPEESDNPEIPSGSVKAKRRIFESGDKNGNVSDSGSDINGIRSNLDVTVSSSRGSGLDRDDAASADSAPEDMAPAPYEKITFTRNKSRKGDQGGVLHVKKPRTERSADKVHSKVIIQKDGTMEIQVNDDDDVDDDDRISIPDNDPPPLPYDRITYPPRKKKQQCRVM